MKKILTLALLIISIGCCAQNNRAALEALLANDTSDAHLLFTYPDTIRNTIFRATTYPRGFTQLDEIQKQSAASFKNAISSYNKKKQEQWWNLARFPSIFPLLINNKNKSEDELKSILTDYPEGIRKNGIYFMKHDYNTLLNVERIHQDFEAQYKSTISNFPSEVQKSFQRLLLHPELLAILSRNMKTTETLGKAYRQEPALLKHIADSVSAEIAKQEGAAYEQWKKGIYEDKKVQKDLKKVSQEYIREHGNYTDDIYEDHQNVDAANAAATSTYRSTPPYSYWSGYPYWYTTPYWYPYPWWVQSGYYWNPYSGINIYGMPSYYFGSWYYNYPNYYRYPNATRYFENHYQNYPRNNGGYYYNNRGSNWPSGGGGGMRDGGGMGGGRRR